MRVRKSLAVGLTAVAASLTAVAAAPAAHAASFPYSCGDSSAGNWYMAGGTEIDAVDGFCVPNYELEMQADGNLVEYNANGSAVWSTNTWGHNGAHAMFQTDGNFVIYSSGGTPLWSSGTWGHSGAHLSFQTDGNLVIYSSGGSALWASGSNGR